MEPPKAESALEVFNLELLTIIKPDSDICITCPCSIRIEILEANTVTATPAPVNTLRYPTATSLQAPPSGCSQKRGLEFRPQNR
jgi:hypothetical protein